MGTLLINAGWRIKVELRQPEDKVVTRFAAEGSANLQTRKMGGKRCGSDLTARGARIRIE